MKLFYLPDTKAIEIDKPAKLIPCQPFLKESKTSKWNDIPDDAFYAHLNKYNDLKTSDRRPRVIKVHKVRMAVIYTTNEVGEPWFQLSGNVPHYVLNGIANVLKEEYYDSIK